MGCVYKFKDSDREPISYNELMLEVLSMIDKEKLDIDDLVFSRASGEMLFKSTVEKIKDLKQESILVKDNKTFIDGEPIISANDAISSQELIDSPEFKARTKAKIAQIVEENFVENQTKIHMSEGMTEEEAKNLSKNELMHWHLIQQDAKILHMLISNFNFGKQVFEFEEKAKDTIFENVASDIYETMGNVLHKIYMDVKSNDKKSVTFNNLNLKIGLEGIDKDLLVHMDKVIVDGDGGIHVYLFKTTTMSPDMWSDAKWEKYKILVALIKRSLESLGFDPKNVDLNIVPVRIKYSEDFSKIDLAVVLNPKQLNMYVKPNGGIVDPLLKEYNWVKKLIKSNITFDNITAEDKNPVNEQLNYLFLNLNLKLEGVKLTAESWIKHNIKDGGKIRRLLDPDYDFIVYFDEEDVVKIPKGGSTNPLLNDKLIKEVEDRTSLLDKNEGGLMLKVLKDILRDYDSGIVNFTSREYGQAAPFLQKVFEKYFKTEGEGEKKENEWKFVENDVLTSANILAFWNKNTYQLDFIVLSPYDLKNKTKLKKSDLHILGDHLYTGTAPGSLIDYKPTFGNLEATRAALIINQILPKLGGEFSLGKLHVVSLERRGLGNIHELETLQKNLVTPIIQFMNENPNLKVKNNFIGQSYINPFDLLILEYKTLLNTSRLQKEDKAIFDTGFELLEDANTVEAKRTALLSLAERFPKLFPELADTTKLEAYTRGRTTRAAAAKLYQYVLQALRYYETPEISSILEKLSSLPKLLTITERIPNKNFLVIQHVYTRAIDNVADKVLKEILVSRKYFLEYYNKCGYSRVENDIFGGQANTFNNLFELDDLGNPTLTLKNPYNEANDLKDYEREFLKKVLFSFNRIRSMMYGKNDFTFTYNDINSKELKEYAEKTEHYFDIPLERASQSTRMLKNSVKDRLNYGFKKIKDAYQQKKNLYDVYGLDLSDEEIADREESIAAWSLRNKFDRGEVNRIDVIGNHDVSYFETNLDKLLIDFTEKYYEHVELNKALLISKAVIFELEVLRGLTNDDEVIDLTEKLINDFNKVNIFNSSIMEKLSQQILGLIQPLRTIVSKTLIAGNIISRFRDEFEGVWLNTMRSLNKFQTNINLGQVMQGYKTVIENSFTDPRSINIVNLLNLKYRLSNIDLSRISEGMKTEGGIVNYNDWLYSTIRRPDFLNRMVLFVAQCYKDGVYDAFSINDNGELVYDWKKDKRFSIYASGDKSNPEYAKQMGAYYNAVRSYNRDHPDRAISFDGNADPLPEPYSDTEIKQFKQLANSIYGAYDKSTKAMYEYMAIGTVFGMFSTWMNGMYANYFAKPGQYYSSEFRLELATDASGNLLFFDDNGNIIYKKDDKYYYDGTDTEVTENLTKVLPVMDKIPIIIQGVWYSLVDASKALRNGELKEWLKTSPQDAANIRKLLTDLLASLLFTMLFKHVITPAYKDYKKEMVDHPFIENATMELLYKSSSRSFDGFKGPINILQFVGENANPPMYGQPIKLAKETASAVFGPKTMIDVGTQNIALFKVVQDSYKAEKRK